MNPIKGIERKPTEPLKVLVKVSEPYKGNWKNNSVKGDWMTRIEENPIKGIESLFYSKGSKVPKFPVGTL